MGNGKMTRTAASIVVLLLTVFYLSSVSYANISAGCGHTLAIKNDGSLWAWGSNSSGLLGDGTSNSASITPEQIGTAKNWLYVSAGCGHSAAIRNDGTLWTWGGNSSGQIGDGTASDRNAPVQIGAFTNWLYVSVGVLHTVAIRNDGTLWAWGGNPSGQLGDGTYTNRYNPVQIGSSTNWAYVSAGATHTVAIQNDGTLWAWGGNLFGQLGNGTYTNSASPVQIGTATNWSSALAGASSTLGIQNDGTIWAWGDNTYGQLAQSSTVKKTNTITSSSKITSNTASQGFIGPKMFQQAGLVLLPQTQSLYANALYGWGRNMEGQLGDNTTTSKYALQKIGTSTNWSSVAGGFYHSVGIKNDGSLWAWGNNNSAQLGDNDTNYASQYTPVQIGTTKDWLINDDIDSLRAAYSVINDLYAQYIWYFGAKSGSITTLTAVSGTYYVQWFTNGKGLLAWTDGAMYYWTGSAWTCMGVSWRDTVAANAKIKTVYNQYPSYFGTRSGGAIKGTTTTGTYYAQLFANGTALLAWPDGYMYYWDGTNLNNMSIVWRTINTITGICSVPSTGGATLTTSQASQIQAMVTARTNNANYENVPGMVMGIKRGNNTAWYGTAGYSNTATSTPIQYTDKFRVGSVSKTFTATIVLQLAQEGKLSLTDSVAKWLPSVASTLTNYDLSTITILNLLNHTSGIHTYTDFTDPIFMGAMANPTTVWTSSQVMAVINTHVPDFTPGTYWVYSNSNYYLLGLIIQAATGDTYENQVKTRIFTPLGMTNSEVPAAGNPNITGSYAHGYMYSSTKNAMVDFTTDDPSYPFSAGSIICNIPDLLTWIKALYNGTLLNTTYHNLQMTFVDLDAYGMGNYLYGMGFMVEEDYQIGGHRGQIFAYDCSIQHYIPYNYDMAVCVNRSLFDENVVTYSNTNALILYDTLSVLTPGISRPQTKRPQVERPVVRTPLTEY